MNKELTPLEALKRIYDYPRLIYKDEIAFVLEQENLPDYYNIVKTALTSQSKTEERIEDILFKHNCSGLNELDARLKAFDIIKEKRLDIDEIYHKDYEWYLLDHKNDDESFMPTKEEFDLLKKVFS